MPLYYFDIDDNGALLHDVEGSELSNDAEARAEALATIGSIAKDQTRKVLTEHQINTSVRDELGKAFFQVILQIKAQHLV